MEIPFLCSLCWKNIKSNNLDFTQPVHTPTDNANRNIFFSPVGTHFNFGMFTNSNKVPKVIIMGVTTSGLARKKFVEEFKSDDSSNFEEQVKKAAFRNTFNGDLKKQLTAIINLSGLLRLLPGNITHIPESFFGYYDEKDPRYQIIFNECYFSQAVICSSLDKNGNSDAPKRGDIDSNHLLCINAQNEILKSFKGKAELIILLGTSKTRATAKYCFEKAECFSTLEELCKDKEMIIEIPHPSPKTRDWNFLNKAKNSEKYGNRCGNVTDKQILKWAKESAEGKDEEYRRKVCNGANKLLLLRKKVGILLQKC